MAEMRKAANDMEEDFMAFQGRQRIYCDLIQHHGVMTLMMQDKIFH